MFDSVQFESFVQWGSFWELDEGKTFGFSIRSGDQFNFEDISTSFKDFSDVCVISIEGKSLNTYLKDTFLILLLYFLSFFGNFDGIFWSFSCFGFLLLFLFRRFNDGFLFLNNSFLSWRFSNNNWWFSSFFGWFDFFRFFWWLNNWLFLLNNCWFFSRFDFFFRFLWWFHWLFLLYDNFLNWRFSNNFLSWFWSLFFRFFWRLDNWLFFLYNSFLSWWFNNNLFSWLWGFFFRFFWWRFFGNFLFIVR
jgi:hypothetical protein